MTVRLRRRCGSPQEAERLRAAVTADNPGYVSVTTEGGDLVVSVAAASASSVRTSIDDLLACLGAAERAAARTDK